VIDRRKGLAETGRRENRDVAVTKLSLVKWGVFVVWGWFLGFCFFFGGRDSWPSREATYTEEPEGRTAYLIPKRFHADGPPDAKRKKRVFDRWLPPWKANQPVVETEGNNGLGGKNPLKIPRKFRCEKGHRLHSKRMSTRTGKEGVLKKGFYPQENEKSRAWEDASPHSQGTTASKQTGKKF